MPTPSIIITHHPIAIDIIHQSRHPSSSILHPPPTLVPLSNGHVQAGRLNFALRITVVPAGQHQKASAGDQELMRWVDGMNDDDNYDDDDDNYDDDDDNYDDDDDNYYDDDLSFYPSTMN